MEEFINYMKGKAFSDNTISSYTFAVEQLLKKTGGNISDEHLLGYKDNLAAEHSAKTVNIRITAINCYLDYIGYCGIRLKGLKIQQKPFLDNVISQQEYEQLRDSLREDGELFWYYLVRFLACTGARISELRQFTVEAVSAGYLDLVSKGQKLRRIYIPTNLQRETLTWLHDIGRLHGYVFTSKSNNPMSARGISLGLKRFAAKYDINQDVVYPHSFRHRFAKNFIKKNPDIAFLADLMGHENLETTRIYLRRTASEQRAAVDEAIDW